jgi:hypothetical protein
MAEVTLGQSRGDRAIARVFLQRVVAIGGEEDLGGGIRLWAAVWVSSEIMPRLVSALI